MLEGYNNRKGSGHEQYHNHFSTCISFGMVKNKNMHFKFQSNPALKVGWDINSASKQSLP